MSFLLYVSLAAAILLGITVWSLITWMKLYIAVRSAALLHATEALKIFDENTDKLFNDPDTPYAVLSYLVRWGDIIHDKKEIIDLAKELLHVKKSEDSPQRVEAAKKFKEVISNLQSQRPDLYELFEKAKLGSYYAGMYRWPLSQLAIAYQHRDEIAREMDRFIERQIADGEAAKVEQRSIH